MESGTKYNNMTEYDQENQSVMGDVEYTCSIQKPNVKREQHVNAIPSI